MAFVFRPSSMTFTPSPPWLLDFQQDQGHFSLRQTYLNAAD